MPLYIMSSTAIQPVPVTSFSASGYRDRSDLQRLLRENIEIVAPDTLIVAEEFGDWDGSLRRIDLLGVDREANLVVIELKRDDTGGNMELQALRYAAMVARMTFDQVVSAFHSYRTKAGASHEVARLSQTSSRDRSPAPREEARAELLQFLDWTEPDDTAFAQDVRIVLVAADVSRGWRQHARRFLVTITHPAPTMKAEQKNIGSVLTEQLRYVVPAYQRPYTWGVENTQDLLTDIEEAYTARDLEYFIGSLITIELEPNKKYEVVDGQQRLTTLNLIFARLRHAIDGDDKKLELEKRILPRNPLTDETESPRLILRKRDQKFFREHVLDGRPLKPVELAGLDAPKARMAENMAAIDAFLANRSQEWLRHFANYILVNVYVVVVKTDSFRSAYRLFNVLNDRGLGLSNADLIKNRLFSQISESNDAAREELEESWTELEEIAEVDNLDTFLGYHRTTLVPQKARKSLAEEFESILKEYKGSALEFVNELLESARNYERIVAGALTEPRALRPLGALKRVTYDEWVPALLAYLNRPVQAFGESEFVGLLERITMQNWVRRLGRTARNTIYYRLISAINDRQNADRIRQIFREGANNEEFFRLLNGDVYGLPSARAVLLRLEEGAQDDSVTKTFAGMITIEHILPQALKDPYWRERFDDRQHQEWVHRLGNLALLSGTKNTRAQYYAFPKKKEVYLKRNEKVSFDLTKEVCAMAGWSPIELAARQERMMDIARRLWRID